MYEGPAPAQPTHPHDTALALLGLFQEGGADPSVSDSDANELEFLALGDDYVNGIKEITDVANGIGVGVDGKTLRPACCLRTFVQ